ncbi:MAG: HPr family phosphocarrier protein [Victivallales bacterium]|nr:HPr family phosphocarrier protein [Victivallales bacterium]
MAKAEATVEIKNSLGLHARPAALFVQLASEFTSEITVEKDGESVNGKSLMGLLMLSAGCGTMLKLIAEGNDCDRAIASIADLINDKFQEEE